MCARASCKQSRPLCPACSSNCRRAVTGLLTEMFCSFFNGKTVSGPPSCACGPCCQWSPEHGRMDNVFGQSVVLNSISRIMKHHIQTGDARCLIANENIRKILGLFVSHLHINEYSGTCPWMFTLHIFCLSNQLGHAERKFPDTQAWNWKSAIF